MMAKTSNVSSKQECIPVVAICWCGGVCSGGGCLLGDLFQGGCLPTGNVCLGVSTQGGLPGGGGCLPGCVCPGGSAFWLGVYTHPPVDRQTPVKHNLSITTFADGESNDVNKFSRRCLPKCANHIHSQWDYTELTNRFWWPLFADWLDRNNMNCFFLNKKFNLWFLLSQV